MLDAGAGAALSKLAVAALEVDDRAAGGAAAGRAARTPRLPHAADAAAAVARGAIGARLEVLGSSDTVVRSCCDLALKIQTLINHATKTFDLSLIISVASSACHKLSWRGHVPRAQCLLHAPHVHSFAAGLAQP